MNHEELLAILDKRLDKIEDKLDKYLDQTSANTTSIDWLRGSIKILTTFIFSLAGGVILALFKLFAN